MEDSSQLCSLSCNQLCHQQYPSKYYSGEKLRLSPRIVPDSLADRYLSIRLI